jgi:YihY family inner membrane protein
MAQRQENLVKETTRCYRLYKEAFEEQAMTGLREIIPECVDFYEGRQWPRATESTKNLPRPVVNIVKMICRAKKGAILSTPVKIQYKSYSPFTDVDKFNSFASSVFREMSQDELDRRAIDDGIKKGSYFFHYYWNPDEISSESNRTLTIASVIVLLWSASKGVFAIIGGLNSVYEIKENRNYFVLRITAMFYTVIFIFVLIATVSLLLFGTNLYYFLVNIFPNTKEYLYIVSSLRFFVGFLILVLFFALIYKALPNKKKRFSEQLPGAIVAGTGWICFSVCFSLFVENFGNYESVYGSLTTITIMMLWLYICMYILFFGALMNVILENKSISF